MKQIKFGLKLWSTNINLIEEASGLINDDYFNYIELTFIPNTEVNPFKKKNISYILHLPTNNHGFNIGIAKRIKEKIKIIKEGIKWADQLNSKYIIIHPGFGSLNDAKSILKKIKDKRIIIENMPKYGLKHEDMLGYNPEQIEELKMNKFGFCFDLNHAIKAAVSLNYDYKDFINKFSKIKPDLFHISDGKLNIEIDEHLQINEGDYDWDFLINYIKKSGCEYITLETPRKTLNDDLINIKKIKEYM